MKATFFAGLAFAASAFSSVIPQAEHSALGRRQLESQVTYLDALYQDVLDQTTQINATRAEAPENPTSDELDAIAEAINPRLEAITEAIVAATNAIVAKRDVSFLARRQDDDGEGDGDDDGEEDGEVCDAACFTERVLEIVYEITSTIRAIIQEFGLGAFVSRINPLLLALSALVIGLNVLVSGLLLTVNAVVTTILGGLGLSLLLLGWG